MVEQKTSTLCKNNFTFPSLPRTGCLLRRMHGVLCAIFILTSRNANDSLQQRRTACIYCVAEKKVEIQRCPGDVALLTNNIQRKRDVTWPDPVFVGPDNATLEFDCTKTSGSEFFVGLTTVSCHPLEWQSAASCTFTVNITGKNGCGIFRRIL